MKTAISIPDPVFQSAEMLASRLGLSRSELYAKALESFIQSHDDATVTGRLDAVYDGQAAKVPPDVAAAQAAWLEDEGW